MISRPTVRPIVEDSAPTSAPPATWATVVAARPPPGSVPRGGRREPAPRASWPGCAPSARPASRARSRDRPPVPYSASRSDWRMSACSSSGVERRHARGRRNQPGRHDRRRRCRGRRARSRPPRRCRGRSASPRDRRTCVFGKGPHGGAERRLVVRRVRAERVLHAVAELASTSSGTSFGRLGHEVDADALRADEPHDLLDLVEERLRRVLEQQVRLVEEEDELRLGQVARPRAGCGTAPPASTS